MRLYLGDGCLECKTDRQSNAVNPAPRVRQELRFLFQAPQRNQNPINPSLTPTLLYIVSKYWSNRLGVKKLKQASIRQA